MRKLLATCFALVFACSAYSQQWTRSDAPRPRDINDIEIFNLSDLLVAGGNRTNDTIRGAFTSNSGGLGWDLDTDTLASWIKSFYFKDSLNGIAAAFGGKILKSTTGGKKWFSSPSPINRDFNKIFFVDSLTGFIAGGKKDSLQTILKTTNGGQSWSVVRDVAGHWLNSIYFTNANDGIAVGDSATILKTTNGGTSWSPITSPIVRHLNALWFTDANNGIIVGGNFANDSLRTILTTNNGGASWTVAKDELGGWLADVRFINQTTGYAVGAYRTLLKTTDGGQNWLPETVTAALTTDHFLSVNFQNTGFGLIGGEDGKIFVYASNPIPQVYTLGSEFVTTTEATMVSGVKTFGAFAHYSFRYSLTSDFSGQVFETPVALIQSDSIERAEFKIVNLTPNTTYYFVAKAKTLAGAVYGDTLSFFTGNPPAEFQTLAATNLTNTSAQLNGMVKGISGTTTLYFQYGTTPALGNELPAIPATVSDSQQHPVQAQISSLVPGVIYYFRLKGVGITGNIYGNTLTFFSGDVFTLLETQLPLVSNDSSAAISGIVEGFRIPAVISFDYGVNAPVFDHFTYMFGDSTVNDTLRHTFTSMVQNLSPGNIYYYRIKAKTAAGTYYGDTIAFFTGSTGVKLQTQGASKVTSSSAQLNATIERFYDAVDLIFQYGTDLSFTNEITPIPASVSDTLNHSISATLNGLQDNTLYYFRIKAETANGASLFGNTKQFYTGQSIPNWDFQNWAMDTVLLPTGWNVVGTVERASGHSGNYALKLIGQSIALLGYFNEADDGPVFYGGVPLNARPDSISFYANYFVEPGDTALFLCSASTGTNVIAGGFFTITGNSGGAFQRLSFPLNYNSADIPEEVAVGFAPTNPDGGGVTNNFFIVDDIRLSNSTEIMEHGDFEDWYQYSYNQLQDWQYNAYVALDSVNSEPKMVSQAYYSYPDDYAAELTNRAWEGTYVIGALSSSSTFNDHFPAFPVAERHQTLNGFYQYYPVNGDTMQIEVMMFLGDSMIGQTLFIQTDSVTEFTPFELKLNYYGTALTPDGANIRINTASRHVRGTSRMLIDKLRFDGFANAIEPSPVNERNDSGIKVFPNPAASSVTIQLQKEIEGDLRIYSQTGQVKYTEKFKGHYLNVSTADFPQGIYVVAVLKDGKLVTNKLMIIK